MFVCFLPDNFLLAFLWSGLYKLLGDQSQSVKHALGGRDRCWEEFLAEQTSYLLVVSALGVFFGVIGVYWDYKYQDSDVWVSLLYSSAAVIGFFGGAFGLWRALRWKQSFGPRVRLVTRSRRIVG